MGKLTRLLPSLTDFAFLLPIIFLFARMNGTRALLGDGDTGWHVRTGEWILANGRVPTSDIFSFTKPGQPWYAWEWLSDILMAGLHHAGGMQAVVLAAIVLICTTFLLLYRLVLRKCGNVVIAFAVTAVAAAGSAIHWLARPHLFTLLFAVIFLTVLEDRRMRRLWVLPFLTVIWTNLHGGFFIGMILTGAYGAGELIAASLGATGEHRRAALIRCRKYALVTMSCLAASFINPYSWHLHAHLFEYLMNPGYFEEIAEFLPISFHHPLAHFYEPMLLLGVVAAFRSLSRRRFSTFLLILAWAHLSLLSSRNIPLFLLVAAAPVAEMLAEWMWAAPVKVPDGWLHRAVCGLGRLAARLDAIDRQPRWHFVAPAVVAALAIGMYAPAPLPIFQTEYDPAVYPKAALADLRESDRVFTDDEWGDYLIYHSHPPRKVFVDGRSDFYGPEFEKIYLDILHVHAGWKASLDSYRVDTILARVDTPLTGALRESGDWQLVHEDSVALIFRRTPARP